MTKKLKEHIEKHEKLLAALMFQYDGEKIVYSVRFSLGPVAKASHRWLVGTLGDQLKDLETRTYNKGKQDARDAINSALKG